MRAPEANASTTCTASALAQDVGPTLPPFVGLPLSAVTLITNSAQAQALLPHLLSCDALGFDTESQPTFVKGQKSNGPHLIQLSTEQHAYLFPLTGQNPPLAELQQILQAPNVLKIGFGLRNDIRALQSKYQFACTPLLDLARALRDGKKTDVGAKTAVARILQKTMSKPKNVTTSNWGRPRLSSQQILYAANDAYAALMVYRHWCEQKAGRT